ncbi:hypothetical protein SV7mr_01480 [Stieleria bergensis]|uniref:Peptidase MA-like domain-containing protein n=2 Tax=Stieleria bergensis TaxID=2528025 RepID=A0A517SNG1_9BACT|nr:hypothetical protein SV7mr_01480 [Planctomycetes bacterium SV_7m_r]
MEANIRTTAHLIGALLLASLSTVCFAAHRRTQNFLVQAPTQKLADRVAEQAERYRLELAQYWLGRPIQPWQDPCPIEVVAGPNLAAQGVTNYNVFPVGNFQMKVIGTPERILDSVLPHEVTHTVLATHFGKPLPRWADEGICTTVEHSAERTKHDAKLLEFLSHRRGIPMNQMFLMKEYPSDILPLYAQGYSVCEFLIAQSGPREFIKFIEGYMQHESWTSNVRQHYGYQSLADLQNHWLAWVRNGRGPVDAFVSVHNPHAQAKLAQQPNNAQLDPNAIALVGNTVSNASDNSPGAMAHQSRPAKQAGGGAVRTIANTWYHRQRDHEVPPGSAAQPGSAAAASAKQVASGSVQPFGPPSVHQSGQYSTASPPDEVGYGEVIRR